jgi:tetratricopeptide (TPR) repeat protein
MVRLIAGIFFFVLVAFGMAQPGAVDSVYGRFRKILPANDTAAWKEIRTLEMLAASEPAAGVYLQLARADAFIHEREREQAFGACMDALDRATTLGADSLIFRVYYKIGDVYMEFNDLPRALSYFNKAFLLASSVKNINDRIFLLREIALVYTYLDKNGLAVDYFRKIIPLAEQAGNQRFLGNVYNNLGICYTKLRDSSQAGGFLLKSLSVRKAAGDKVGIAQVHNNLGSLYFEWGDYPRAMEYYTTGLELRLGAGVPQPGIIESNINLGKTHYRLGQVEKARGKLEEARAAALALGHIELERRADEELLLLYSKLGDYRRAFDLQARYFFIRDSLYGLDKKEEISRLTFENKIREDSLRHAEARLQAQAVHEEKEKRSAFVRNFLVAGFVLMLGVAFLLFKQVQRIKQAHRIIEQQRNEIEARQKEVLDSIHYARRIQQSLLASESYINRNMKRLLGKTGSA